MTDKSEADKTIKHINMKEKIISKLQGDFEVTKVEREDWDSGVAIVCEFMKKGKTGKFTYTLEGGERGIDEVTDYKEEEDDDIYDEIYEWVQENIDWRTIIKWGDEEIN